MLSIEQIILQNIEQEIMELEMFTSKPCDNHKKLTPVIINFMNDSFNRKKTKYIELKRKYFDNHIKYKNDIDMEDALKVSKWIKKESSHMIVKTPTKVYQEAKENGCISAYFKDEIIGYISLSKLNYSHEVYEIGSLIIDENYKNLGVGKSLKSKLMCKHKNKLFYSISNVTYVEKINISLKLIKIDACNLPLKLLNIIEEEQVLLYNDSIFVNQNLFNFIKTHTKDIKSK